MHIMIKPQSSFYWKAE